MIKINMKPFTDTGIKITPELTDDWVISSSLRNNQITLFSNKLSVGFDVPLSSFINDLKRLNITITGDKLIGNFLFDGSRHIYSDLEYNSWLAEQENINANFYQKTGNKTSPFKAGIHCRP